MKLKNKIKKACIRAFSFMHGMFNKQKRQILFESFNGRSYSDNPRAISEKMHELFPDYEIIWAFTDPEKIKGSVPEYISTVKRESLNFYRKLSESFCYVVNEAIRYDTPKRKGQIFVQTWHGDRGFKKILYDAWEDGKRPTPVMDEKLTDIFIVGSKYASERIKTAFRYSGQTLAYGCPRNDCLINPANINQIRESIGVAKDKKIVLYAPTLRENSKVVKGTVNIEELIDHLRSRGGEWVCLVRAHPKSVGLDVSSKENIIDVSSYMDMSDLLMVSDMLITDYSSCAGDFVVKEKPVILAQFDLERYMAEDRTFHVNIEKIGYYIAHSQQELNNYIDQLTDQEFEESCKRVMNFFGTEETGYSSEKVCQWIDEQYKQVIG